MSLTPEQKRAVVTFTRRVPLTDAQRDAISTDDVLAVAKMEEYERANRTERDNRIIDAESRIDAHNIQIEREQATIAQLQADKEIFAFVVIEQTEPEVTETVVTEPEV